jgi:hypothetical protein
MLSSPMVVTPNPPASPNSRSPRLFSVHSEPSVLRKTSATPATAPLPPRDSKWCHPERSEGSAFFRSPLATARSSSAQDCANREQVNPFFSVLYKLPIQQPLSFDTLTNARGGVENSSSNHFSPLGKGRRVTPLFSCPCARFQHPCSRKPFLINGFRTRPRNPTVICPSPQITVGLSPFQCERIPSMPDLEAQVFATLRFFLCSSRRRSLNTGNEMATPRLFQRIKWRAAVGGHSQIAKIL